MYHDPLAQSMLDDNDFNRAMSEIYQKAISDPRGATAQASSLIEGQIANIWQQKYPEEGRQLERLTYARKVEEMCSRPTVGPDLCSELRTLGQIRNRLVHDWRPDTDFNSDQIAPLVDSLKVSRDVIQHIATTQADSLGSALNSLLETRPGRWVLAVQLALQVLHAVVAHKPISDSQP